MIHCEPLCELCGRRESESESAFGAFIPAVGAFGERVCWECFSTYSGRRHALRSVVDALADADTRLAFAAKDAQEAGARDLADLALVIGEHVARVLEALRVVGCVEDE